MKKLTAKDLYFNRNLKIAYQLLGKKITRKLAREFKDDLIPLVEEFSIPLRIAYYIQERGLFYGNIDINIFYDEEM